MRKVLFFAFALVAGTLAFNSCNGKDQNNPSNSQDTEKQGQDTTAVDPGNALKNIKFYCDIDRGQTPTRQYLYFGLKDDFEWGWEIYEDQERTKKVSAHGDYGTYVLNVDSSFIDMTFAGSFEEAQGERVNHEGMAAHKDGRWTYKLDGDTIYITAQNGNTEKYWKL